VGTRADNGVMSNYDDRNGGEADVAYEAVAQLTVLTLHVLGQDLCDNLIWQVRALFAPPPPA
jgi:hypothetical protein